jgi:hypothetical protein
MTECTYIPQISAEFGKVITDDEIDFEFQAIENVFLCFEEQIGSNISTEDNIFDHGIIDNSYTIDPAFGIIHYMEVQGDVELTLDVPVQGSSKIITLIIGNAGSLDEGNYGRFNFKNGVAWACDRDAPEMDGKPWNMYANLLGDTSGVKHDGYYGSVVTCVYDDIDWVFYVYARHHLDIFNDPIVGDIYDWR